MLYETYALMTRFEVKVAPGPSRICRPWRSRLSLPVAGYHLYEKQFLKLKSKFPAKRLNPEVGRAF